MLISSGGARGKCPVCGAANCSCGGPTTMVGVDERLTEGVMGGPDMVVVPAGRPGVGIKMTRAQAAARGVLREEKKAEEPAENKKRTPGQDKKRKLGENK